MIINRVTITGADNSISPQELHRLTEKYPFVEWGILLSKSSEGRPRFPTLEWMAELVAGHEHRKHPPQLSGHLCGKWVRDICKGNWDFYYKDRPQVSGYFNRFQLNFHAYLHKIKDQEVFVNGFKKVLAGRADFNLPAQQFIFQLDDVNNSILDVAQSNGIDAVPLFDLSGGAGVLPDYWPEAREGYCGYAGGLSPENLPEQLAKINEVVREDQKIWIDVETHVRSADDQHFDLEKVERFLQIAQEHGAKP